MVMCMRASLATTCCMGKAPTHTQLGMYFDGQECQCHTNSTIRYDDVTDVEVWKGATSIDDDLTLSRERYSGLVRLGSTDDSRDPLCHYWKCQVVPSSLP